MSENRLQEFDRFTQIVNVERAKLYGHPKEDFGRVARLKEVVAECKDPLVRHVLEMVCVKVARLIKSPDHLDSWIDIAGYARTGVMVTEPNPQHELFKGQAHETTGRGGSDISQIIEHLYPSISPPAVPSAGETAEPHEHAGGGTGGTGTSSYSRGPREGR